MRHSILLTVFFAVLFSANAPLLGDVIEEVYHFQKPQVQSAQLVVMKGMPHETFHRIVINGLPSNAEPGSPVIPQQPVSLLLPQGCGVERIEVTSDEFHRLEGVFRLPPSQQAYPLSKMATINPTVPNPEVYGSNKVYPSRVRSDPKILWCRGYGIVAFNLYPVRYEPSNGRVYYSSRMKVRVYTRPEAAPQEVMPCRGKLNDILWLERMVANPELVKSYRASKASLFSKGKSKNKMQKNPKGPEIDPFSGSNHPYVIITNEDLAADPGPNNFQTLLKHRAAQGMKGVIKTVEEIYEEFPGEDAQEKIRNFCRYAYTHWNTEYLLLGGDGHDNGPARIIPARGMWVTGEGYIEKNLKADLYYGNLDGSFNYNGNSRWGEIGDGPGGGEVDLFAELFVGRASVSTAEELHNFVMKTIAYETDNYEEPWYTRAHFVGEFLWGNPNTWGGDYMDEIKDGSSLWGYTTQGFPDTWNKTTLYEKNGSWGASKLTPTLNSNNLHILNHLGHASIAYVMKLSPYHVENLTNTRYFFAYSQGCNAGGFSSGKCMAEYFTLAEHGAFGSIMNDKYGWGEVGNTDGSSQYFHREFIDALYGEGIVEAGRMNADSKEDNLWCIDYKSNRWCAYETNLFGDPVTPLDGPQLSSKGQLLLDRSAYKNGGIVEVTVKDTDLNTDPSLRQEILLPVESTGGDAEQVVLREAGLNQPVFTGFIDVVQGAAIPGDDLLSLAHEEVFEFTYIDEDDGLGGTNIQMKAQAEGDFLAPSLSNLNITMLDDTQVKVQWDSNEPVSGTLVYGFDSPPENAAYNHHLLDPCWVQAEDLLQCSDYLYYVIASDAAGNETLEDNSGQFFHFTTLQRYYPLREEMNKDPEWTITSGSTWEWGQPQGESKDPDYGRTGPNVYGYNLEGPYENNLGAMHLTTPVIDCSGLEGTTLDFWRQLTILGYHGDKASLSVSVNGTTWTEIYHNPISPYHEPCWLHYAYDISAIADGQPTVYVRWTMGPTSEGGALGGWNIDDVTLSGIASPSQSWLDYKQHVIDDTTGGNGNGFIEPKETLILPLTLLNTGLDAQGVQATLTAYSPEVTLIDDQADFPDMGHNEEGTSLAPHYSFYLQGGAEDGDELAFGVDWTTQNAAGSFTLFEHVSCPRIVCSNITMVDTSGDGDGYLDPGETVTLMVELENIGSLDAKDVSAQIQCSHPQYITISDPQASFGDIPVNSKTSSQAPHFTLTADPSAPNYTWVDFTLAISAENFEGEDHFDIEITDCILQFFWPLDSDPGWTMTGKWEFGEPQGSKTPGVSLGCPDPSSGYTGLNVLGYNLLGSYGYQMNAKPLTSKPIDCSGLETVKVRFKRWLGVGSALYDHASFQASNDGVSWVTFWEHTDPLPISDGQWVHVEYDISSVADHESTVYLRWIIGPTSYAFVYCGWNIDDIELWGK